jgi:radical SAM protein with 4Fe4S-binding SPASM domain
MSDYTYRILDNDTEEILRTTLGIKYIDYRKKWNNCDPNNIPSFPIHLDLEFYDNCNQRCTFCPRNEDTHSDLPYQINTKKKIDELLIAKIINETKNKLLSVNFGAFAEPLIYKNIFSIVKRFHESGVIDSRIITNGLLLNKFHNEIFESNLVNLYVSLDAFNQKTYFNQRGKGFELVVKNLLDFIEKKKKLNKILPIIRVSFVETELNKNEIIDFVNFWKDKVNHIDLQKMIFYNKKENTKNESKQFDCIDPFRRLSIISDGSVLPCCSFWGRALVLGNINEKNLIDIWNGEEINKVRKDLLKDKSYICNLCQSGN